MIGHCLRFPGSVLLALAFSALAGTFLIGVSKSFSANPVAESHSVRQFSYFTNDVTFDPGTARLYASVPSRGGATGNSIARINPVTGVVEGSVFVGSEPGKLALANVGNVLYVSLDGAGAVRQYDLGTQTAGAQFTVSDPSSEPFFVKDLSIAPGDPNLVAVSRKNVTGSPDFEGVAVYDNGVRRALATPRHTGSDYIGFSNSASTLYGFGFGAGFQTMSVGPAGVSVVSSTSSGNAPVGEFKVANGLMYLPYGQVYDPANATLLGTFAVPLLAVSRVEPDPSVGRVYFLTGDQVFDDFSTRKLTLTAFDQNTFLPVGSLDIPNVPGRVSGLVRWGANGLAFGSSGGQLYIIQTTLVPSNEPVPTPTATPSSTPTPSPTALPTPAPGDLREVAITAKDIVINPASQIIYASVPSNAGSGGNSITPIDPVSGTTGQPMFIGSEPNKLAISDNGQFIYVGLDGAAAVRRFDVASGTPGVQFSVGSQQAQYVARDIAVAPGQPQTVAVARGSNPNASDGGVAIYDDGVQRPITIGVFHTISAIEYSSSPLILYGHNNANSEFGFRKIAAASCGVSILSVTGGLLSGARDFKIEDGLAYSSWGRVADPETGTLIGTYPVTIGVPLGNLPTALLAESKTGRVYFFSTPNGIFDSGTTTLLVRAYDMRTFTLVGSLSVPNITGAPTAVVRWGANGFAFRTIANKVYLLQTSVIPPPIQPPPLPASGPTPPTYTLRGQVSVANGTTPTVTMRLTGSGQSATTTTNSDGSFSFTALPLCADFTVTPDPVENYSFSPASRTITPADQNNPNQATAFFNMIPKQIGFNAGTSVSVTEGGTAMLTVTRFNDVSAPATVDYRTTDSDTFMVNCSVKQGQAYGRCDFAPTVGTLSFAPGETSKTFAVPIIDDGWAEGDENFGVALSNPTGATLGAQSTLTVTIHDNETTDQPNPIFNTSPTGVDFFVRQHYLDFLGREPEQGQPWSAILNGCADQFNTDPNSPSAQCDRITVSGSFFGSPEFKDKGFYVIDMYRVAFNRLPTYVEFSTDLASISGTTAAEVFAKRAAYANNFVQRTEFTGHYDPNSMTNTQYVNALTSGSLGQNYNLMTIHTTDPANPDTGNKVTLTTTDLINGLNGNTLMRAQVLRSIAQSDEISLQIEAINTFVASQYYGYLRRTPELAGFNSWVNYLTMHPTDFRTMVNGFVNSNEYRLRFGPT